MSFVYPLAGGLMLSSSTTSMLAQHGRVLGMSGLVHQSASSVVKKKETPEGWRISTLLGILAGGALLHSQSGAFDKLASEVLRRSLTSQEWRRTLLSGLLVGVGTKLGSGCTSGHMLVGCSRFSPRSMVATVTFFLVAMCTARSLPSAGILQAATGMSWAPDLATLLLLQLPALGYTLAPRLPTSDTLKKLISTWSIGMHFAFGLALAGMTRPSKVISFFNFPLPGTNAPGPWDPSLAFVALGGLLPNMFAWQTIKGWKEPVLESKWSLPTSKTIDWRLVVGAAVFGLGWGLSGICPGPMLTVLGSGNGGNPLLGFAGAFLAGSIATDLLGV